MKINRLRRLLYPAVLLIVLAALIAPNPSPAAADAVGESRGAGSASYHLWHNPTLIGSDDDNYASCDVLNGGTSQYLYAFFDMDLPDDAVIKGIEVKIKKKASANSDDCYITDATVQLMKQGVPIGENKASGEHWGTSEHEKNYGGSDDLWDDLYNITWSRADVSSTSSGFGVTLRVMGTAGTGYVTAFVDCVQVKVYYESGAPGSSQTRNAYRVETEPYWQSPDGVTSRDGSGASYCREVYGISPGLYITDFGFNIPEDAIISGIEARIRKMANRDGQGQITKDDDVQLLKGGEPAGDSRATSAKWNTYWYETTYGGPSDLWGTTWTPAQINDTDFGLMLQVFVNSDNCAYVDYIEITVTYITPPYDADTDSDGLSDYDETITHHTNPLDDDSDDDGLKDNEEVDPDINTDPWNPDCDNDDLSDYEEVMIYFTDPKNADTDGDGYSDNEELTRGSDPLDINSIPNRSPAPENDSVSTAEDTPATVDVLANDVDPDGDVLTITSAGNPSHGTAVVSDGKIVYTPAADYYGADSFTYTVSDGITSATATVNVTVTNVNDNPSAADDEAAVASDSGINCIDVLQNDSCLPDPIETLRITAVTQGGHGTVKVPYGGDYLAYMPESGYAGTDSFTYTIGDGNGGFDTAAVTVTVDDNPAPATASVSITRNPGTGTADGSWANPGKIIAVDESYTHSSFGFTLGYSGNLYATDYGFNIPSEAVIGGIEAKILRKASDHAWDRYIRTHRVSVMKAGSPLAVHKAGSSDWETSWVEANYGSSIDLWITAWTPAEINDTGFGIALWAKGITQSPAGIQARVDCIRITVTYSIARSGTDADGDGLCDYDEAVVCLTNPHDADTDGDGYNDNEEVLNGGDPLNPDVLPGMPVTYNDSASTDEDTPVTVDVLANDGDPDGDVLTITSVGNPSHGAAAISGEEIVYTPADNYYGSDSFTYTVSDGTQSATATISVTVTNMNDNPNAADDQSTVALDSGINWIDVLQNDSVLPDPVETLTVAAVTQGANGTVRIPYSGSYVVYMPDPGYIGTDSFTYTVGDSNGGFDTAAVTVTVVENPAPATASVSTTRSPETGTKDGMWYNPGGIRFADGVCTSVGFGTAFWSSGYLYATVYNFNIPSEAVISGIEVGILRKATENTGDTRFIRDQVVSVMKTAQNLAGDRSRSANWATSWGESTYGNSNDLWARTWTPSEINDPGFGMALSVKGKSNSRSGVKAFVDCISITVYYSIARTGTDSDSDGLCDYDEVVFYNTNPHEADTDGDGYEDGLEVFCGSDPLNPSSVPDLQPAADVQFVTTCEDTAVDITLTGSGAWIDPLTFSIMDAPSHGILTGTAPELTYTPAADYHGNDSFTFKVNDGHQDSNTATVSITVNPVNDPPAAEAGGPYSVDEGDSIMLTGSGTDVDIDTLTYEWDLNGDDTFETTGQTATFSASGLSGPASFIVTLKVSDGGASDTDTAEVTVNNVAPVVDAGPDATIKQGEAFTSAGSFIDPGADTWTATVDYGDGSGVQPLALSEKTFALYHVYAGYGVYDVTVTVTDGDGDSGTDTVRVTPTATPTPTPVATPTPAPTHTGGGGYAPPPQTVAVNIQDDGISFQISAYTTALDTNGNPITEINAETIVTPPSPPDGETVVAAFDFEPDGATFYPAIQITVTYDPAALPEGADESQLVIAFYNEATGAWEYVSGTVNPGTNTITFSITHFTVFAVMVESEPMPAPAETLAPTPTPTPTSAVEPTPTTTAVPTPTTTTTPTATPTVTTESDSENNRPDNWILVIIAATGGAFPAALISAIVIRKRKSG